LLDSRIKSHPALAYFIFAFLISWALWFIAPLAGGNSNPVYGAVVFVGACGPVLAAFIVSSTINRDPSNASRSKRFATFAVVFAVTYVLPPLFALFVTHSFGLLVLLTSLVYSTLAGYVISSVYHPNQGIATVMAGLKRVSLKNAWVWVAVLLPFVWQVLAVTINSGFGGNGLLTVSGSTVLLVLVSYPTTFLFGGPLTEEPGWRGFATPSLQQKFSPLGAGLIVGVAWSCWHFPLYFQPFYGGGWIGLPFRLLSTVPLGVVFAWFYNRSGGNLFASMLFHCSINASAGLFGSSSGLLLIAVIVVTAIVVVVYDKMYRKNGNPLEQQMVRASSSDEIPKTVEVGA